MSDMAARGILTIGHSNHPMERFADGHVEAHADAMRRELAGESAARIAVPAQATLI